ncbi:MHS family MFS transporter [Rhodococcus sp. BP-252]|uniref:MFS transporter n=1 Tax=unclassified Rhodococcus (in: high G+C Gram-positive bacteria) TaxID=192944 RepID=UPI000DF110F9|nr:MULTISPECIES: MFS transporter [unclassified Rhodococcus (in: high G+C Gram-positive bacteria)]MBY6413068.1 MHS family MFS transporter [Rhodococcus sp. BP-320]MBY6417769.1 MHS family MFS transporter [Rhodococcus sp. BP-321]MBY6423919.1 MHS family MFS transporter [Rhodococcus sp. BP-324]MBY6427810.1 MHS family MFS transporter [Rhodococcus sp. BP-323]MBY6431809.1 MHS family MFS transporter [Rhodococcus sp. BP-322]
MTAQTVDKKGLARAFAASLTGTALEWYDFAVYSAAAALVFPIIFFPDSDPLTGTLLAFSTYAVGYIARPIGGFVFGRLGDVIGRKQLLVITLLLIGVTTFLIGLIPSYDTIGIVAPILLVTMRFAQGVAVGGEWGGAVLLSSEYGNPRQRGFWSSAAQIGPPAGNLLANGALAALTIALTEDQFESWGWRIAFLFSAVLVGFGLWIRLKLEDTPVFKALQESGDRSEAPISEVFKTQLRPLVAAILSRIAPDVIYALFTVFSITYGVQKLGFARSEVLTAILIGSAFQLGLIPLAGAISDRINRRLVYGVAAVGGVVWSAIFFLMIGGSSLPLLILGVVVGLAFHSFMYGPQAAFVTEQFTVRLRSTGSSLAYTIAGVFGGAMAPLIFVFLLDKTDSWVLIVGYIAVVGALTVLGLALGRNPDRAEEEDHDVIANATPAAGSAV